MPAARWPSGAAPSGARATGGRRAAAGGVGARGRGAPRRAPRRPAPAGLHVKPLVIHRNWDRTGCGPEHRPARAEVPRVLEPDRIVGVHDQPEHLLEGLLAPPGDEDLLRAAAGTPRGDDVLGDGPSQPGVSLGVA